MEHQGDIYRFPDLSQPLKGQPGLALVETMCGPNATAKESIPVSRTKRAASPGSV